MTSTRTDGDYPAGRGDASVTRRENPNRDVRSDQSHAAEEAVHQLADELALLTASGKSVGSFLEMFLHKLTQAVGGVGAACWTRERDGQFRLWSEVGLHESLHDSAQPTAEHYKILECVVRERQPTLVPPRSVKLDRSRPQNPCDDSLIIIPMRTSHEVTHLLEVVHASSGGPASQRGYLRFVMQMSELLVNALRSDILQASVDRADRISELHRFIADLSAVAEADVWNHIANSLRSQFGVTQLILLKLTNQNAEVVAFADTSSFDERSRLVLAIQKFAQRAIRSKTSIQDPSLHAEAQQLAERIGCTSIDFISSRSSDSWFMSASNLDSQSNDKEESPPAAARLAVVCGYQSNSEQTAWEQTAWEPCSLLASTLKILSQQVLLGKRRLFSLSIPVGKKRTLVSLACAVALFAICLVPVPQKFEARAVLRPKQMVAYYAPVSSTVERVLVEEGETVEAGQTILYLNSDELAGKEVRYNAEIARLSDLVADLRDTLGKQSDLSGETIAKLKLQQHNYELELAAAREQQTLIAKQIKKLAVVAKETGVVSTFGQSSSLVGKPVQPGAKLVATIPNDTTWVFELEVPQRRWGSILDAFNNLDEGQSEGLPVNVSMLGNSVVVLACRLVPRGDAVSSTVYLHDTDEAVVKAYVKAPSDELPIVKDGAVATAAIDCGRVSLGWLLVRDAYLTLSAKFRMLW